MTMYTEFDQLAKKRNLTSVRMAIHCVHTTNRSLKLTIQSSGSRPSCEFVDRFSQRKANELLTEKIMQIPEEEEVRS